MRRILIACIASLLLYGAAFGVLLDRPLTLGALQQRIDGALSLGAAIEGPKLVILAGSNGPYSHRCELIGPLIGRPCVNAGVAVGVGLDYLFLRWKTLLRAGDVVYMPLEEAQYIRGKAAATLGPDAAIMLRHDRASLWQMPPHRQMAAVFSADLRAAIMSLLEATLMATGFHDPRAEAIGATNVWGDHIGHTLALAEHNVAALAAAMPYHPAPMQIASGYGTALVRDFLGWAARHGVTVIGGLPTGFADSPLDERSENAVRGVYDDGGAAFLALPNRSRYPRAAFFDSPDHLNEPAQIRHSRAIALALQPLIGPPGEHPVQVVATHPVPTPPRPRWPGNSAPAPAGSAPEPR